MSCRNIEGDTRLASPKDEANAWRPSICGAKDDVVGQATHKSKNELFSIVVLYYITNGAVR
ncbi:hypothetical protein F-liban_439 [Faustovirus]|nr:hypothetical protein F-liban_439 [Faustovirus]